MKTLQEALEIGESIDIEFKSWIKAHNMKERISLAVDELIAFANCKGGTVYLCVEDNCDVTGCTGKYDLQAISESIYDKTRPPMFTEIEEIEYEGKKVISMLIIVFPTFFCSSNDLGNDISKFDKSLEFIAG